MGADLQLKSTMVTPTRSNSRPPVVLVSPPPRPHQSNTNTNSNSNSCNPPPPPPFSPYSAAVQDPHASSSIILAYEHYLRLPALSTLWTTKTFPEWKNESIVKPSLQALEITFRLISIALSDPRPYSNHRQWSLRLESLSSRQIQIIALLLSNHHDNSGLPIASPSSHTGVIPRDKSSQEVWHLNLVNNNNNTTTTTTTTTTTSTTLVSHTSEASLLPRLAAWDKSEDVASKILLQIESQMYTCPFTLGLGEPNLAGKQNNLEYDLIVRPSELHSLKKSPLLDHDQQQLKNNQENQILFTIHQIIESWLYTAQQLLERIGERIDGQQFEDAASDCWVLEMIWMLLSDIEDLHLLMDPDDFLRLTTQLAIRSCPPTGSSSSSSSSSNAAASAICFRSRALLSVTKSSKDLKQRVPQIVGVEADPNGGPRVQEAAMKLLHSRTRGEADNSGRIHLLQAFQAVEGAVKRFFFAYRQLVTAVMGSLEATGNRGLGFALETSSDSLCQMFMDPPYFPSLDAAKTFLGELWQCEAKFSTSTSSINHNY